MQGLNTLTISSNPNITKNNDFSSHPPPKKKIRVHFEIICENIHQLNNSTNAKMHHPLYCSIKCARTVIECISEFIFK